MTLSGLRLLAWVLTRAVLQPSGLAHSFILERDINELGVIDADVAIGESLTLLVDMDGAVSAFLFLEQGAMVEIIGKSTGMDTRQARFGTLAEVRSQFFREMEAAVAV